MIDTWKRYAPVLRYTIDRTLQLILRAEETMFRISPRFLAWVMKHSYAIKQ